LIRKFIASLGSNSLRPSLMQGICRFFTRLERLLREIPNILQVCKTLKKTGKSLNDEYSLCGILYRII
jgi:hypothetical protein